jgi:hypothetical protein
VGYSALIIRTGAGLDLLTALNGSVDGHPAAYMGRRRSGHAPTSTHTHQATRQWGAMCMAHVLPDGLAHLPPREITFTVMLTLVIRVVVCNKA